MVKKIVALFTALVMALSLVACGSTATSGSNASSQSTTTNKTEKTVTIRLAWSATAKELEAKQSALSKGMNAWFDTVEKESGGTIKVNIFGDSQLASGAEQIVSGIKSGAFEMANLSTGSWAEYTDAFAEMNVPFLFTDFQDVFAVQDSEVGNQMYKTLQADVPGVLPLFQGDVGFRHITNNKVVIDSPTDLQGVKIRTMSDTLQMAAMTAMGANVTPVPYSEIYSALQQGLVDAQENPLVNIYNSRLYEVQKYCTFTNHSYTTTLLFMNKNFFDGLSKNQQAAILKANDAAKAASREAIVNEEDKYKEMLKAKGMEFTTLNDESAAAFQNACETVWKKAADLMGQNRFDALLAVLKK